MKKSPMLIFLVIASLLLSCEEETIVSNDQDNMFYATVNVYLRNAVVLDSIPHYWYSGYIISSKISYLKYVVLNMDTIPYNEPSVNYFNDENGYMQFSMPIVLKIDVMPSALFEIATGLGSITGDIIFPDSVNAMEFNKVDTISVQETLVMNFQGNADYYLISYSYSHLNSDSTGYIGENRELYVKQPPALFDSTLHPFDGYLNINYIYSFNGPLPEINSLPNMFGDGKGYLNVRLFQNVNKEFVVGTGFSF